MGRRPMSGEEALRLINTRKWYHRFEILPGIATPGQFEFNAPALLDMAGISRDLRGLKALDIRTCDGEPDPVGRSRDERCCPSWAGRSGGRQDWGSWDAT